MDVQIKGKVLTVRRVLKSNETYKVNKHKGFESITIFKKPQVAKGWTSICSDGLHVLFADYDETARSVVETELSELSKEYGIFYLFCTKEQKDGSDFIGNYHAVCLTLLKRSSIERVLREETSCDRRYVDSWVRTPYKSYVLRLSEKKGSGKPKFLKVIGNAQSYLVSSAHKKVLETLYPEIPRINYHNEDGSDSICFNTYETRRK